MPTKKEMTKNYVALILTKNALIKKTVKFILSDTLHCQTMLSAPDGKQLFKSSTNIKVLILDWALQDKYGSILKALKEAKARKNVLVVNVFNSTEQKNWVLTHLPNIHHNNKIYTVVDDLFSGISLPIALYRVKSRLKDKLK
jgi:predicted transposase YbfD/YdcC